MKNKKIVLMNKRRKTGGRTLLGERTMAEAMDALTAEQARQAKESAAVGQADEGEGD